MNDKQRIIILVGIVLLVATTMFPPYDAEFRRYSPPFGFVKKFSGYGPIWSPNREINLPRLLVQYAMIIACASGGVLALRD